MAVGGRGGGRVGGGGRREEGGTAAVGSAVPSGRGGQAAAWRGRSVPHGGEGKAGRTRRRWRAKEPLRGGVGPGG